MKNFLKFAWYHLKRCGTFLGLQVIITLLGFALMLIPSDVAHIIIGVAVVILNCFLFFLVGKSAAPNDFKYKRINAAKFGGKPPYFEACKEMKLSKAIVTAGIFYAVNLILVLIGSYADVNAIRVIIMFEFMGIMMISSGTGFTEIISAGRPYLFPALFCPVIVLICAAYVGGYFLSMAKRNRQHREIQDEIAMFDKNKII